MYCVQAQAEADGQGDSDDDLKAAAARARTIDPLAPVDHSAIEYDEFAKDFYTEHATIAAMTEQQVCGLGTSGGQRVHSFMESFAFSLCLLLCGCA